MYTYGDSNWKDKLTGYNGTSLSYDAQGNLTGDGTRSYTWICGRQLWNVVNDISSSDTFRREIDPLLKIRDAYPKLLIARIYQPAWQYEGIRIIDAAEWLAGAVPQN